jgi:hypothetical protein
MAAAAFVLSVLTLAACGPETPARAGEEGLRSNLAVARSLVTGIGRTVLDSAGAGMGDTVLLDVDTAAVSWIPQTEFAALLGAGGRRVLAGGAGASASTRWTVRGTSLSVEYRDIRKPGIFSGPVVDRIVTATISSRITSGGTVVFAGTHSVSAADTIPEDRVAEVESGSGGITTGGVPHLRSLDRYVEPFVIIGATGVAILLFFQVRS